MVRLLAVLIQLLLLASQSDAVVNLLTNGSFEIEGDSNIDVYALRENPNILSGWHYQSIHDRGDFSGVNGFIPTDYASYPGLFSTPFGSRWLVFGSGTSNPGASIKQVLSLSAGLYKASAFAKGYGYNWQPITLGFEINITSSLNSSVLTPVFTPLPFGESWAEFSVQFEITELSVVSLSIIDKTPLGSAAHADLYVDNASLQLIPEPSSLSLLLAGGAVLMASRRTRGA